MIIRQRRVRVLNNYLPSSFLGTDLILAVPACAMAAGASRAGFNPPLNAGQQVLPAKLGPITRFNAEGRNLIRRDLPKEIFYQERDWTWTDWSGETHFQTVFIPRERYPREKIPPPALELRVSSDLKSDLWIHVDAIRYDGRHEDQIKHAINVLLEVFGECHVLDSQMASLIKGAIRRLNWAILPPGAYPWTTLAAHLKPILSTLPPTVRVVVERHLQHIDSFGPTDRAVGLGGFSGYMIFVFKNKGIAVLESRLNDNATYVLDEANWAALSQLTKAELLSKGLHKKRIIHRDGWDAAITKMLK